MLGIQSPIGESSLQASFKQLKEQPTNEERSSGDIYCNCTNLCGVFKFANFEVGYFPRI